MRLRFVTSTPLEVTRGSGTFVGITTLAASLERQGAPVEFAVPRIPFPVYTVERLLFNQLLRFRQPSSFDATVSFDMDGYTLPRIGRVPHIAFIKGVIADEMRFESGLTRATMRIQAACERKHVHRADAVFTTSEYSAQRIRDLYQYKGQPHILPELIDLRAWNKLLQSTQSSPTGKFIVLSVCRFYPRKRLHVLLHATARLRDRIPNLEVRIVGGGPETHRLKKICAEERLDDIVTWRENIPRSELAQEYQQCDVFCLPSVQEGFGIVFLEAMASGKPIVAARAAAVPEVVRHGLLVKPEDDEALANALEHLYRQPDLRQNLAARALEFVAQFDAPIISTQFARKVQEIIDAAKNLTSR